MTANPLVLRATYADGTLSARVESEGTQTFSGRFALELTAGTNRSLHRGVATFAAGQRSRLSTVTVTCAAGSSWRAVLTVEPDAGEPYVERAGSA